ncbi:hypothetical protein VE25_08560 [Devosia geojensis]|uniref:HTH gntR-type domain-containing protein n=1 Tax=Devosia geojensis TaxID=443610 RepID=A0A0F5FTU3_9HYPH|nr:PLP-dependent aminotransferase family protein [Devosia geojensis]KKB12289.1 hypothetical protein VE25_08560 [Devosia geojensis]
MSEIVNVHQLVRLIDGWESGQGKRSELLASTIKSLIDRGRLPAGVRMPSERLVATTLGVARVTVSDAFNILRDVGALSSRAGVGTFVSSMGSTVSAGGDARLQSFLQVRGSDRIDLRNAAPPAVPMVGEVMADLPFENIEPLLRSHGYVPQGLDGLIEAICIYYTNLGLPTRYEEVLVTAGAQQAVHLVASCVIVPGDTVVVEDPTFRGGIECLRSIGARLVGVQSGVEGVDLDELETSFRRYRPRLALLMTTVHNPTGTSISESKRRSIGALADRYNVTVVDDASTSDLLFSDELPRPMAAFSDNCITIGSASKSFWGGLRIGWIRARAQVLGGLLAAKGAEDLGTSIPAQLITSRLLPHIDRARAFRRASLQAALQAVMDDVAIHLPKSSVKRPTGGASLWLRLPEGLSASVVCAAASRDGVDLLPGPTFSISHSFDDHIRIGYAAPRMLIADGIARLGRTIQRLRPA